MSNRRRAPKRRADEGRHPGSATHWGDVAGWYDEHVGDGGGDFHENVVLPGALRLLGKGDTGVEGMAVLDVACGQGVLCRQLAERGARPVGFDASEALIRRARERSPELAFHVGDAREIESAAWLAAGSFDAAACLLALSNIQPIRPVFDGVAKALRPAGRLAIVVNHPAFRGAKETHWGWDADADVQYRRVDRYLLPRKAPIVAHPGRRDDGTYTWTYHRPIGAYVKALARAGLLVDALEEWPSHRVSQPGARAAAENRARKEIPMFLAIRAIKPG